MANSFILLCGVANFPHVFRERERERNNNMLIGENLLLQFTKVELGNLMIKPNAVLI